MGVTQFFIDIGPHRDVPVFDTVLVPFIPFQFCLFILSYYLTLPYPFLQRSAASRHLLRRLQA